MTDTEKQIEDLAAATGLPPATVVGVCSELAKNPDHARKLELCHQWGVGWQEMQRLADMRPRDLNAIGKGIAQQGFMLCALAQAGLAKQLSDPAKVALMEAKELSTIAKQQNDIGISQIKETPASMMGGGNTINIIGGGSIQEILAFKAMKEAEGKQSTVERLAAKIAINSTATEV